MTITTNNSFWLAATLTASTGLAGCGGSTVIPCNDIGSDPRTPLLTRGYMNNPAARPRGIVKN